MSCGHSSLADTALADNIRRDDALVLRNLRESRDVRTRVLELSRYQRLAVLETLSLSKLCRSRSCDFLEFLKEKK